MLSVIMLHVVMLRVIMLSVILLRVVILRVVILRVVMLSHVARRRVISTLAYYDTMKITAVKCFIVWDLFGQSPIWLRASQSRT